MPSGTITLIDGPAGSGKTTLTTGMPELRAMLDTEVDGGRWVADDFVAYENCRDFGRAREILIRWADDPKIASIAVDTWSYFWQTAWQQVQERGGNIYRAIGPAQLAVKRLYDPLVRAKRRGKHVCLTAHTKDNVKVDESADGKMTVQKEGLKHDAEALVNNLLDMHLRIDFDLRRDTRSLVVVKPRANRRVVIDDFLKLPESARYREALSYLKQRFAVTTARIPNIPVGSRIEIPRFGSTLMYGEILRIMGDAPESTGSFDSETEDASAQAAMQNAAKPAPAAAGGKS